MDAETALFARELQRLLNKVVASIERMDEAQLNWKPPVRNSNSPYALAAHVLGNLEAWVLGIVAGQAIERDRPGEFAARGSSADTLVERATTLGRQFDEALSALPPDALAERRDPPKLLWGEGEPKQRTVREALMETIEHAAMHIGQIQLVEDMAAAV